MENLILCGIFLNIVKRVGKKCENNFKKLLCGFFHKCKENKARVWFEKKNMKVDHTSCHSSEVVRGKWPKETLQIFSYTKNMGKFWSVSKDPYSIKHKPLISQGWFRCKNNVFTTFF